MYCGHAILYQKCQAICNTMFRDDVKINYVKNGDAELTGLTFLTLLSTRFIRQPSYLGYLLQIDAAMS